MTVLHRLFVSGSDRSCDRWHRDYRIDDVDNLKLHHLYRAMAFLGEETDDSNDADEVDKLVPLSPRCVKDRIEEQLFENRRDLFSSLDFVFFDTTSIYFEGNGGNSLGHKGYSKDHRPDLNQMIVGAVLDNQGNPICCEMWPGNTADVTTLIPVTRRLRDRFGVGQFCLLADRGMISTDNRQHLDQHEISYILGARMRRVNEIKHEVLKDTGDYQEVYPERPESHAPSPLNVKEVMVNGRRYIVCLNEKQARKDAADRQVIVESLQAKLEYNPKALIGNKGYRQYVNLDGGHVHIDQQKIDDDARYDGKWVLQTNTSLPANEVALKYIEDNGKSLAIRSECLGVCGKVFQAVGVALPPTIREL